MRRWRPRDIDDLYNATCPWLRPCAKAAYSRALMLLGATRICPHHQRVPGKALAMFGTAPLAISEDACRLVISGEEGAMTGGALPAV